MGAVPVLNLLLRGASLNFLCLCLVLLGMQSILLSVLHRVRALLHRCHHRLILQAGAV